MTENSLEGTVKHVGRGTIRRCLCSVDVGDVKMEAVL